MVHEMRIDLTGEGEVTRVTRGVGIRLPNPR